MPGADALFFVNRRPVLRIQQCARVPRDFSRQILSARAHYKLRCRTICRARINASGLHLVDVQLVFPQRVPAREKSGQAQKHAREHASTGTQRPMHTHHTTCFWHSHWVPLGHHLRPVVYLRADADAHAQLALHAGVGEACLAGVDGAENKRQNGLELRRGGGGHCGVSEGGKGCVLLDGQAPGVPPRRPLLQRVL